MSDTETSHTSAEEEQVEAYMRLYEAREDKRKALEGKLLKDITSAASTMLRLGERPLERGFVLAVNATCEGVLETMQQRLLEHIYIHKTRASFAVSEVVLLQGKHVDLKENGVYRIRPAKLPLEPRILFTIKCLAKAYYIAEDELITPAQRDHLKVLMRLRDRMMHPKKPDDLDMTTEESDAMRAVVSWLYELSERVSQAQISMLKNCNHPLRIPGRQELDFFEIPSDPIDPDSV